MLKNIFGGLAVGVANIIPGVSGGTIMVLVGLFDKVMEAITVIFGLKSTMQERFKSCLFLGQFLIGVAIGLVAFAKILEFLFEKFPNQTLFWFLGLILFSIPFLKKKEMNNQKLAIPYFLIGILIIGLLTFLSPKKEEVIVPLSELLSKTLNPPYLISLILLGMVSGATMIFPGISGSMVLLVLGEYHLFKGYVANVTTFDFKILVPLCFIAIGVGLGIILSSFLTNYLLKKHKRETMSLILGFILMSCLVLVPTTGYTISVVTTSIICFLFGGSLVILMEKFN